MSATSALAAGRRAAEGLMLDTVRVVRLGSTTTDPDTGDPTTPETELYAGRGKVQTYEGYESRHDVAEAVLTLQRYQVHIPVGAYDPKVGDVVEITTAAIDPHLTGRRYRVVALLHKTLGTAYRLGVEEMV